MDEQSKDFQPLEPEIPVSVEKPSSIAPAAPKKKRGMARWIVLAVLFLIGVIAGILISTAVRDINGASHKQDTVVEIPQGTSVAGIASRLKEAGSIRNDLLFRLYVKWNKKEGGFQYGNYEFPAGSSFAEIAEKLTTQGAVAKTVRVTIPEGTGICDFVKDVNGQAVTVPGVATLLENAGVCKKEDFFAALKTVKPQGAVFDSINETGTYYPLEGYLFPETYDFYCYDSAECARLAVEKMLEQMNSRFTDEMKAQAAKMNRSVNEILTMASIVQMESGQSHENMAKVAAVFYNRLASPSFSSLGSSPTCYYGNGKEMDDGRYNTYNIQGLPPGPLCSPGIEAIRAALYPDENTTAYYFVTDSSGKFYFHNTAAEQQATIDRLKKDNQWIYEYLN